MILITKKVAVHRSSKGAQEAHEAIVPPTSLGPSTQLKAELSTEEFSLYLLIWKQWRLSAAARLRKPACLVSLVPCSGKHGQVVEFPVTAATGTT